MTPPYALRVAETWRSDLPFTIREGDAVARERATELEVAMPTVCERRGGLTFYSLALGLWLLTSQSLPSAYGAEYEACKFFSQLPDDCAAAEHRNLRDASLAGLQKRL